MEPDTSSQPSYPVQFDVDYPDRELNRWSTAFRIFAAIPILILVRDDRRHRLRELGRTYDGRHDHAPPGS